MKTILSSLLISTSLLAAPVFAQEEPSSDPNTVLATINGNEITYGHIIALASRLPPEYETVDSAVLFDGILDQLIQQELLSSITDPQAPMARLSIDNEQRSVLASIAISKISIEATTEEKLQEAYEAEIADFVPTKEYNASHILVETEEEAFELVDKLNDGADFAELAMEFSTGPSGPEWRQSRLVRTRCDGSAFRRGGSGLGSR